MTSNKQYTHLDVRGVMKRGRLLHTQSLWGGKATPKTRPSVDDNSVLVGLVNQNIGGAFTVVIDDDETFNRWKRAYSGGPALFAGSFAQLYDFSKDEILKYRVKPEDSVVILSQQELKDLSRMEEN
ncbi:hypothetical protein HY450_03410 [Candidatus Pacearchaeota archaeon]|nr:hypothetical protein [Candidatus Pacearchaeota archaeon]